MQEKTGLHKWQFIAPLTALFMPKPSQRRSNAFQAHFNCISIAFQSKGWHFAIETSRHGFVFGRTKTRPTQIKRTSSAFQLHFNQRGGRVSNAFQAHFKCISIKTHGPATQFQGCINPQHFNSNSYESPSRTGKEKLA